MSSEDNMKVTRRLQIKAKVVSKSDIQNIWRIINEQHSADEKVEGRCNVQVKVVCDGGPQYESTNVAEILNDGGVLDYERINSISFDYYHYNDEIDHKIKVHFSKHIDFYNEMSVEGNSREWVAGTYEKLETVIKGIKKQEHWILTHRALIENVLALCIGYLFLQLIDLIPSNDNTNDVPYIIEVIRNNGLYLFGINFFLCWVVGSMPSYYVLEHLVKFWPNIEFDFGPEHEKTEKKRRGQILFIVTAVVIPIILAVIFEIINTFLII